MTTKKPTKPSNYEPTEFDFPMLRLEPVQTTPKRLELTHAGINTLVNSFNDKEQEVLTKEFTFLVNATKH